MKLGPQRHNKMASGASRYWITGCGRHAGYKYMGIEGAAQPMPVAAQAAKRPSNPKAGSKASRAMAIFESLTRAGLSRSSIIAQFMEELDMTKAGASTYYANCKKKAA